MHEKDVNEVMNILRQKGPLPGSYYFKLEVLERLVKAK